MAPTILREEPDFWAVWCVPCIAQFPKLHALHEEFSDQGLVIIGVTGYYNYRWDVKAASPTESGEPVSRRNEQVMIEKLMDKHDLAIPIAIEKNHTVSDAYRTHTLPHVVLIDRHGIVRWVGGYYTDSEKDLIRKQIELLLAEPAVDALRGPSD